jgi:DNA-binding XRE family transcriptional regulator
VSRQTVNALEREKYHPSLPLAFRIAQLFERTIEDVFHHEQGATLTHGNGNGNGKLQSDQDPVTL